jgi:hypothetical protein
MDANVSPPAPSPAMPAAGLGSRLMLLAILMSVLFFQGCQSNGLQIGVELTVGPVAPFLAFLYDEDDSGKAELLYLSVGRAILNVGVLAAVFLLAPSWIPWFDRLVRSRRFQIAALLVAIIFNNVLFFTRVWVQLVYWPIAWTCERIDNVLPISDAWKPLTIATVARGHFLACWAGTYALFCLALFVSERYLGFDRRRWWQFNLRLLMAVTFVVGTTLGLVLRLAATN